jgi:nucleoside-diphosphate-sugar epimerase
MQGVSAVIHCAAYLGVDPVQQQRVNVDGTRNLLAAAKGAEVSQVVCLSTSGVYGGSLGEGQSEGAIRVQPKTSLSRSRCDAEHLVLEADGIVVRPNLVYGPGDRRTITVLLDTMARLNAWIGEPDALVSAIPVDALGRLIAALVIGTARPGVYHAALAEPVAMRALLVPIYRSAGMALPMRSTTPELAEQSYPRVTARQLGMIARDNWYDSRKIWEASRLPGPTTIMSPETTRYYSRVLKQAVLTLGDGDNT